MKIEYRNIHGNRKHKDALFRMVFSSKKELLELYNAMNGTSYKNEEELTVNTLESALYMTVKNDVSFIVDCTMNLYEHQSSYNPNIPLRGLDYFVQLYKIYGNQNMLNLYSSALQKIPTPQFVVFYNGLKNEPDRQVLKLSDMFQVPGGCLECEATMININYGRNREIMEKCRPLEEYAIFVHTVRKYALLQECDLTTAITLAIEECLRKSVLVDVLTRHRMEVCSVLFDTFDEELYRRDYEETTQKRIYEEVLVQVTAEVTKQVTEEVTRQVTEEVTKQVTEEVTRQVTNEVTARVTNEAEAEQKEIFYGKIRKKLEKGKTPEQIADELEEEFSKIKNAVEVLLREKEIH